MPIRENLLTPQPRQLKTHASQPRAIMLSRNFHMARGTILRVNLEYKSTSRAVTPPKITSVSAKIHSATFFSSAPMNHLPNLGPRIKHQSSPSLTYSNTTPVPMRPNTQLTWEDEAPASRRDSGYDSGFWNESESSESEGHRSKKANKYNVRRYATLDISFNLPTNGRS